MGQFLFHVAPAKGDALPIVPNRAFMALEVCHGGQEQCATVSGQSVGCNNAKIEIPSQRFMPDTQDLGERDLEIID